MKQRVFSGIYEQLTGVRLLWILLLLLLGAFTLYYTNILVKSLAEREKKYVELYAKSIQYAFEIDPNSDQNLTFIRELIDANTTVPVIYTAGADLSGYRNVKRLENADRPLNPEEITNIMYEEIGKMRLENTPIELHLGSKRGYVFYSNSSLLNQLQYFPIVMLAAFLILGSLAFMAYSSSRKAEENRVWVGLAKETAHQLGTPISALTGWVEFLKTDPDFDQSIVVEIEKDIKRLDTITTRFSSIGSVPTMSQENIQELVEQTVDYLKRRISTKVKWTVESENMEGINIKLNRHLLEWVIENLCKNAVDAMGGIGEIHIQLKKIAKDKITIDVRDTGKGMAKNQQSKIFKAGFSTKKRGWGLGLTLAKRIIETYHGGELKLHQTEVGKGTTFRIVMKA